MSHSLKFESTDCRRHNDAWKCPILYSLVHHHHHHQTPKNQRSNISFWGGMCNCNLGLHNYYYMFLFFLFYKKWAFEPKNWMNGSVFLYGCDLYYYFFHTNANTWVLWVEWACVNIMVFSFLFLHAMISVIQNDFLHVIEITLVIPWVLRWFHISKQCETFFLLSLIYSFLLCMFQKDSSFYASSIAFLSTWHKCNSSFKMLLIFLVQQLLGDPRSSFTILSLS